MSLRHLGRKKERMHTDPISDLLTRVRNAQLAKHEVVSVPASKIKISLAHILKAEGFIRDYKCIRDDKQGLLKVALKYDEGRNGAIREIKRQSVPSRRVYIGAADIPYVRNGFGIGIYTTSQGIMSDREARKRKIGGEYICSVF